MPLLERRCNTRVVGGTPAWHGDHLGDRRQAPPRRNCSARHRRYRGQVESATRFSANGVTFVEVSPTGKRFEVEVVNGRIRHQNLKPYAFVF
jgi:hypothetical protein